MRALFLAAILASVLAYAAREADAEVAPNQTMFMGKGMSAWRIGASFRVDEDLGLLVGLATGFGGC